MAWPEVTLVESRSPEDISLPEEANAAWRKAGQTGLEKWRSDKRSCCLAVFAPEPCSLLPLLIQGRDSASEQKCEL